MLFNLQVQKQWTKKTHTANERKVEKRNENKNKVKRDFVYVKACKIHNIVTLRKTIGKSTNFKWIRKIAYKNYLLAEIYLCSFFFVAFLFVVCNLIILMGTELSENACMRAVTHITKYIRGMEFFFTLFTFSLAYFHDAHILT